MKKGTRMIDIAESLNISVVTVSNALNNRGGVSPELREMIKKTADETGYHYYSSGKNGVKSESYNIGILFAENQITSIRNIISQLSRRISDYLMKENIFTINETITKEMQDECILPKIIAGGKVKAVIIIGDIETEYIHKLTSTKIPSVFIECSDAFDVSDLLMIDKFNGGYILADYLISSGHKKIGFAGSVSDGTYDIYLGYIKALAKHRLEKNEKWIIKEQSGAVRRRQCIDIEKNDLPTAFVCESDDMALRLINTMKVMDIAVPRDVSVVSYGDEFASDISDPPVTTLNIDFDNISKAAVDVIVKKLSDDDYVFGTGYFVGKLIKKESVKEK